MRKLLIPAVVALVGSIGTSAAIAQPYEENFTTHSKVAYGEPSANAKAPLGYSANAAADRVVNLDKGTKYLNVNRMETVRINVAGKSVTWTFDTLGTPNFPLSKIIPGAEGVTVYVSESLDSLS
ncbi:MAG: CzcE family metal-binding protein [Limnobacter sp.]|uniref:CzcE family metal-binding protein n=1 Tax=Limnobacter sp. TaxID=2003368 RepID=UPI003919C6EB